MARGAKLLWREGQGWLHFPVKTAFLSNLSKNHLGVVSVTKPQMLGLEINFVALFVTFWNGIKPVT